MENYKEQNEVKHQLQIALKMLTNAELELNKSIRNMSEILKNSSINDKKKELLNAIHTIEEKTNNERIARDKVENLRNLRDSYFFKD